MDIKGEYVFDAPQEIVWNAVRDPDVLGSILPGGEGIEEVGENEYVGNLKIKVGPVNGKFQGNIKLEDINEPTSYNIKVDGKGAPGFVKATGGLNLAAQGETQTHMAYEGKAQVGGRIASVGQRLIESSAKSIIGQSLDALNEYVKVQYAAQKSAVATGASEAEALEAAKSAEVPEFKAPSQAQIATNVAKDVAKDNSGMVVGIVIAIAALVAFLLWLF